MSESQRELLADDALVLHVKNWQTADKYAVCFTKEHGKLRFIAYGARYEKNIHGRLLQPFANLHIEVQQGQKIDKLRSCELLQMPKSMDMQQMAYAAVASELTAVLTEDRVPQPELYEMLGAALAALMQRNPRLVVLSYAIKLLAATGFAPQLTHCVHCGEAVTEQENAWFSPLQGGLICSSCRSTYNGDGLEPCGAETRELWQWLAQLDYEQPTPFKVRGGALMELEKILFKFIFFQTDKPLNSLNFLSQLQL